MEVFCVPKEALETVWDSVEKFFAKALDKHDPEYSLNDLKNYVLDQKWKLFAFVNDKNELNGAAIVAFLSYPKSYTAFVTCIGGRALVNREYYEKFIEVLKEFGADRVQGYVTESIERMYKRLGISKRVSMVDIKI